MKRIYWVICEVSIENLKTLKYHTYLKKTVLSITCSQCETEDEKIFKEEKSLKFLV